MNQTETDQDEVQYAARLSPTQAGIFFHCLRSVASDSYVEQVYCDLESLAGPVDSERLARAFRRVAGSHAVLRTAFAWRGLDEPLQLVGRDVEVPVEFLDYSAAKGDALRERLNDFMKIDRARSFDLSRAPLARLTLIRLTADSVRLVFTNHHLILDGWSRSVLFSEFFAACAGREPDDDADRYHRYLDYLAEMRAPAGDFWKDYLGAADSSSAPPGALPEAADYPGLDEALPEQGATALFESLLPAGLDERIAGLAREIGVTPGNLVQGIWAVLMARYNGRSDVVFGTTFAGRPVDFPGFETLVGLCVNTLPVRARIPADTPVRDWLGEYQTNITRVREHELDALSDVFERSASGLDRQPFETVFAYESLPAMELPTESGLRMIASGSDSRSHYPLSIAYFPGEAARAQYVYDTRRYTPDAIARLARHYIALLESTVARPDEAPAILPVLSAEEIEREIQKAGPGAAAVDPPPPIEAFAAAAARHAERIALDYPNARLTYAELAGRVLLFARAIRARGVGRGDRVALLLEPSADYVILLLAICATGAAYLPLDPDQPDERLGRMIADGGPALLIARSKLTPARPEGPATVTPEELEANGNAQLHSEPNSDASAGALQLENVPELAAMAAEVGVEARDPLYVMYTSGSTGSPKGIIVTGRGIARLAVETNYLEISPEDAVGQAANFSFDASTFEIWGALLNGARLVGIPRDALLQNRLGESLRAKNVTHLFLTTALVQLIAREQPRTLAALAVLLFGGERCDPGAIRSLRKALPDLRLLHVYGPTECTTFALYHEVAAVADEATNIPIGRPISETIALLLDENLEPVPAGGVGEICLGGRGLADRYLNQPELSAERFVTMPAWLSDRIDSHGIRLYRTGDLGRRLADGEIEFLGRRDGQLKIRGHRVEPVEIEGRLGEHDRIRQAAVVASRTPAGNLRLVAFVEAQGNAVDGAELRDYLSARLPEAMIPAHFVFGSIPLTPAGKIDRVRLAREAPALLRSVQGEGDGDQPRTALEKTLADIFAACFEIESVGLDDHFYELGGHSLLAVRIVSRINEALACELPLELLLSRGTIRRLAPAMSSLPGGDRLEETAAIYNEVAGLSEEEAERMLRAD